MATDKDKKLSDEINEWTLGGVQVSAQVVRKWAKEVKALEGELRVTGGLLEQEAESVDELKIEIDHLEAELEREKAAHLETHKRHGDTLEKGSKVSAELERVTKAWHEALAELEQCRVTCNEHTKEIVSLNEQLERKDQND